jgi:hypothetical protein
MFLECKYNAYNQINLNEVAQEHGFELNDISWLNVKWDTLYIGFDTGEVIEHNIDLACMEETTDYKRPSVMKVFDENFGLQEDASKNIEDFPFKERPKADERTIVYEVRAFLEIKINDVCSELNIEPSQIKSYYTEYSILHITLEDSTQLEYDLPFLSASETPKLSFHDFEYLEHESSHSMKNFPFREDK